MPDMLATKIDSQFIMEVGTPGTRKSTQALSYPKPQYWFSWDQKMASLMIPMRNWGINPKDIHYDDYSDFNAARAKMEQLQVNCPYATIVGDSITTAANATLRQTLQLKYGTTRASGREAGKRIAGIAVNEIEDYNAEASALLEMISLFKDIKKFHKVNIILIAHLIQAEYKTSASQTNIVRTIVTAGKRVAPMIPAYCEEVYHFFVKKAMEVDAGGDYALLTSSTSEDFARTQLELPREIIFNDKPLYDTWIKPAITNLNNTFTQQKETTQNVTDGFVR
jgi:hypothetical protein